MQHTFSELPRRGSGSLSELNDSGGAPQLESKFRRSTARAPSRPEQGTGRQVRPSNSSAPFDDSFEHLAQRTHQQPFHGI